MKFKAMAASAVLAVGLAGAIWAAGAAPQGVQDVHGRAAQAGASQRGHVGRRIGGLRHHPLLRHKLQQKIRARMLERFDLDKNGKLDQAERDALKQTLRERWEQRLERRLERLNGAR